MQAKAHGGKQALPYGRKTLTRRKRNCRTTRKEILALVNVGKKYRCPFHDCTDRRSLICLQTFKDQGTIALCQKARKIAGKNDCDVIARSNTCTTKANMGAPDFLVALPEKSPNSEYEPSGPPYVTTQASVRIAPHNFLQNCSIVGRAPSICCRILREIYCHYNSHHF